MFYLTMKTLLLKYSTLALLETVIFSKTASLTVFLHCTIAILEAKLAIETFIKLGTLYSAVALLEVVKAGLR